MALSSRHRTRNSSPGGLRPSTLLLGHGGSPQYFYTWIGKKHFCFFQTAETGNRAPNSGVEGSGADHYPRGPALHSFEAGIANAISSFKWMEICLFMKNSHVTNWVDWRTCASIISNLTFFCGIWFDLKLAWSRRRLTYMHNEISTLWWADVKGAVSRDASQGRQTPPTSHTLQTSQYYYVLNVPSTFRTMHARCIKSIPSKTQKHLYNINLFTTIHDGNFRRHSSMNVTIKWHKFSSNIYYIYVFFVIWSWKLR